jgi:AcrR family transcriptional regulator
MAAVAEDAGVSRQTLYKTFGSRNDLGLALLLREADGFLGEVEMQLAAKVGDPDAALEAAFGAFLDGARLNPLVRSIVVDEDPDLLGLVIGQGVSVLALAGGRLAAAMLTNWPQVRPADAEMLADNLVRLAISYAALPAGPGRAVPAEIRLLLAPFIAAALDR